MHPIQVESIACRGQSFALETVASEAIKHYRLESLCVDPSTVWLEALRHEDTGDTPSRLPLTLRRR